MGTEFFKSFETRTFACFAVLVSAFVFAPFLFPATDAPYWFHDHFFNTLQIVENFRLKGFPTFDGVTPTNDFSPLWGLTLCGLSVLVSAKTTAFYIIVRMILAGALCLSLWLFNRLIDALDFQPEKESRFLSSAFLSALFLYMAQSGSEAAMVIPCVFFNALCLLKALKNPSFLSGLPVGLTVCLCAFVRFDSVAVFFVAVLVIYFQYNSKYPVSKKGLLLLIAGTVAGLIPLMIYADIMQTKFGTPVPAEFLSWQTAQGSAPWRLFTVLFYEPVRYLFRVPQEIALIFFPSLILPLVAYASFPWNGEEQRPQETVFYTLLWYPVAYLTYLSFSTYLTLPEYAFYPFAVGAPLALLFAARKIKSQISEREQEKARRFWLILGCLFLLVSFSLAVKPRSPAYKSVVDAVAEFADKSPQGRYAVGTGAGFISFFTKADVVRLDGMAEDALFLKLLNEQASLSDAFGTYSVDYYVAVNLPKGKNPCHSAREPVQNRFGGTNKGMSDWLCADPVFLKDVSKKIKVSIFPIDSSGRAVSFY